MLAADIAKKLLALVQNYSAKSSFVKVRTSVIGAKLEMRRAVFEGYTVLHLGGVLAFEFFVLFQ
jgi:hypothetical protein